MKSLNESNFDTEVRSGTMLVQFWAAWCGPCVDTKHLDDVEVAGFRVGRVNVEKNAELAGQNSVIVVPTYVVYKDGKPAKKMVGLQDPATLLEAMKT
jgi:thioredoxin 1